MTQLLNRITPAVLLFIPILLVVVLAGCGGSEAAASPADAVAPAKESSMSMELKGDVEVDGSSTVFPVTEAVAEEFRKVHPRVQVNVGVSGTGGGFKRFVAGETDISDASRPIKATESDSALENGIEYIALKVGTDGLSVLVSPSNDFVECMTVDELKRVWEPGSTVKTWQDIRPEWPADEMRLYGPDTDSGTFDYFTEEIVGQARASRSDYTASADDNVLVQGIGGDRSALGYFGYAYYAENQDKLKLVAVDSGDGCVLPTDETIEAGEYAPLARPLFIYVNVKSLERPEVKSFVEFYLENAQQLVREVGYIAQAPDVYQQGLAKIR
jgi:phosphate transport system substrate-binding protein